MKTVTVEDSELIQAHLLRLLGQQPRVELVGVAAEEEQAIALILSGQADAALLHLCLSPGSSLRVLERIREAGPPAADGGALATHGMLTAAVRRGTKPTEPPRRLAAQLSSGAEPSARPAEPLSYSAMSRTFFWTATDPNRLSR